MFTAVVKRVYDQYGSQVIELEEEPDAVERGMKTIQKISDFAQVQRRNFGPEFREGAVRIVREAGGPITQGGSGAGPA